MTSFLVTGIGGPAGKNVAELLLERKYRVVGTDMRYLEHPKIQVYQVPPANALDFLATIHRIASDEQVDLIIPTVSEELPVFARDWQRRAEIPILISSAQAVEIADDKYLTSKTLSTKGVNVPRFALPSHVHSIDAVARMVGLPCVSKPRVGRGGREVAIRTEKDWNEIAALDDHYILQEFASGTDYAPNVFVGSDGQSMVVTLEKTELKGGNVGNATKVQRVIAPDVAELAMAAARAVGLVGPLDIDIRRCSDGVPVVLEINASFGANI